MLLWEFTVEKIGQQFFAIGGENRFGMELKALNAELPMLHSHDQAFIVGGRDFEAVRQRGALDDQRVVPPGG